jgi:putative proteasome-type protease
MTYCLAVRLNAGLVFASDTRTTAGVDHVSSYRKMHTFVREGERLFVLLSAGNLATTQSVVKEIELDNKLERERSLFSTENFHDAAAYVGTISAAIQKRHDGMTQQREVSFEATFILGGQIAGEEHELALVYPPGNFISVSPDHPYLQIGETKYGKPILDRFITASVSLEDAARCALVSIDSTIRSNLSVGPPVDLLIYQRDTMKATHQLRFKANTPYFSSLRKHWTEGLRNIFEDLPRFEWERAEDRKES